MSSAETLTHLQPPKRADARRNYEQLIEAARGVFAEAGSNASLEEIARRAGVGIGTLYRHFPTRQALLEAVYVDEVEALSRSASELAGLPPWDALAAWLRGYVSYATTKRALAEEMSASAGAETAVFQLCKERSSPPASRCSSALRKRESFGATPTSWTSPGWCSESPRSRAATRSRSSGFSTWHSTASATSPARDHRRTRALPARGQGGPPNVHQLVTPRRSVHVRLPRDAGSGASCKCRRRLAAPCPAACAHQEPSGDRPAEPPSSA